MQIESFRAATLWVFSVDFRLSAICRALVVEKSGNVRAAGSLERRGRVL
jgi:hypothetical protein